MISAEPSPLSLSEQSTEDVSIVVLSAYNEMQQREKDVVVEKLGIDKQDIYNLRDRYAQLDDEDFGFQTQSNPEKTSALSLAPYHQFIRESIFRGGLKSESLPSTFFYAISDPFKSSFFADSSSDFRKRFTEAYSETDLLVDLMQALRDSLWNRTGEKSKYFSHFLHNTEYSDFEQIFDYGKSISQHLMSPRTFGGKAYEEHPKNDSSQLEQEVAHTPNPGEPSKRKYSAEEVEEIAEELRELLPEVAENPDSLYPSSIQEMKEDYGKHPELLKIIEVLDEHVRRHEKDGTTRRQRFHETMANPLRNTKLMGALVASEMGYPAQLKDSVQIQFNESKRVGKTLDLLLENDCIARVHDKNTYSISPAKKALEILGREKIRYIKLN